MIAISPFKRRLVYVSVFELFGIAFATLVLMSLSEGDLKNSLPVTSIVSSAAVVWNYIYNTNFESWECRNGIRILTLKIRCMHAIGFEEGLVVLCLPIYMLWYGVGIWRALSMEATLLLFS